MLQITKTKSFRRTSAFSPSPVVQARRIPPATKILLAVAAGGRCEFTGCNRYLFEHPITLKNGNFSEMAHIVAFSEEGPRGREGLRPGNIDAVDNLMLLCRVCHREIDGRPQDYPRAALAGYKTEHEKRIRRQAELGPDLKTTIVQLKALIAGQAVEIPSGEVYDAVSPRWPADKDGHVIDLTGIPVDNCDFMKISFQTIQREVERIYAHGMDAEKTRHISLFALGPIPLLMFLGRCLSNKIAVDFFQRHRDAGSPWKWRTSGPTAEYAVHNVRRGSDPTKVALVLSLSGPIHLSQLPSSIDKRFTVYGITLSRAKPHVDFLRRREDLERFRVKYRRFLALMMRNHPRISELHVFPAVPAPVAVACGYDLLPKVHPELLVYDNDKLKGGFTFRMRVNSHEPR